MTRMHTDVRVLQRLLTGMLLKMCRIERCVIKELKMCNWRIKDV